METMSKLHSYWQNRILFEKKKQQLLDNDLATVQKLLKSHYQQLSLKIINELNIAYEKYQLDNSMTNVYYFNGYWELLNSINDELTKLGVITESAIGESLKKCYEETAKLTTKQFGFNRVNPIATQEIINRVWLPDGKNWSDRIWTNKNALVESLREGLIECATAGRSSEELTKLLMARFNTSYSQSSRLAITELAHIQIQSSLDTYKENGIEQVEWYTAHGCCDGCGELDGKRFDVNSSELPPLHPNCRCTVLPIIGD